MSGRRIAVVFAFLAFFVSGPASAVDIETVRSPGGIEAWLIQDPSVPMMTMSFTFRGGSSLDPRGKEGLAEMITGLLDEGAGDLLSKEFQTAMDEIAAGLSFDVGKDRFRGLLRTLTKHRGEAARLLTLALNSPRFDADPVERIRGQLLSGLRQDAENPRRIAGQSWFKAVFPDHPYGRPQSGTPESLKAITADDLRRFTKTHFTRDRLIVGVVGDIAPAALGAMLDQVFGGLPKTSGLMPVPDAKPTGAGRVIVVEKAIPQSVVLFGQVGIKRDDPDYYAAYLMNHILGGGGFSSRLTEEVREKRGLAYSIYSYLNPMHRAGLVMGNFGTQNARAGDSLDIVRQEWARMAEQGVTEEELQNAKNYINGSFPLRLDSGRRIANLLVAIQVSNLGIDYIDRRPHLINAVTVEDIQRVARRLLKPRDLTVVVVGKPEGITATN